MAKYNCEVIVWKTAKEMNKNRETEFDYDHLNTKGNGEGESMRLKKG
jgi:hypothetical protein